MPWLRRDRKAWRTSAGIATTNPNKVEYAVINVARLEEAFEAGDEVTSDVLRARGLVKKKRPVKILGHGEITKALTVDVDAITATAREKITAAGGSVA